jgi:branched-chain amino acid transport system substrate-binding protein
MKKLIVILASAIVLLSSLSACTKKDSGTIKIGVNLELTGDVSIYGVPEKVAFQMAVEEINKAGGINGKQVELVVYDNAYDATKAVANAQKLVEDGVVAMLGSATSGMTLAIAPIAKDNKIVAFTPSGTNSKVTVEADLKTVNPWVFRACFIDPFQGKVLANFATTNLKAKKVAVMVNGGSEYSKELASIFSAQVVANGGSVVDTVTYADADTDYNAGLTSLASKSFDVLFVADYAKNAGLIIGQARVISGLETTPILGPDGFEDPALNSLAGGADKVNNVYFSTHFSTLSDNAKVKTFIDAHKAFVAKVNAAESQNYAPVPSALSALAYDAAYMLFAAIDNANSTDPSKIRDALEGLTTFSGVTGDITFDALHNAVKPAFIITLTNGVPSKADIVNP